METPASAIPHVERESVFVDGSTFLIERPARSDKLLDEPAILEANQRDDYMPYWADIWPAARMLAKAILRDARQAERSAPETRRFAASQVEVLDLGCGLGLAGIAALSCGFRVIFSDYDLTALRFAERNARLNGYSNFRTLPLDWRFPPQDLRVPIILAADLIYEMRNIDPLIAFIKRSLLPDGICLLTDPDRTPAPRLRERLTAEGLSYSTEFTRAGEPGGFRIKGTLYRIRLQR
jgi:ETFB lysine methyltransferase